MVNANDDQDVSEVLDDDKLGTEYPPDEPVGVDSYGVTAAEEQMDEPLTERVAHEQPDFGARAPAAEEGEVGHIVEPDQGMAPDVEGDAVASEAAEPLEGELADGDLLSGDETLRDTATERVDDLTAEEGAVHITENP